MPDAPLLVPFFAVVSLAAATLVSEDLTCVAAGVLVAEGRLPLALAIVGCLAGIVAGDVALMLAGRLCGPRLFRSRWLRRLVSRDAVDAAARWMQARGALVVFASRFVPGTRLATYVASGMLGIRVGHFTLLAAASALLWVPALVGISALAGRQTAEAGLLATVSAAGRALAIVAAVLAAIRLSTSRRRTPAEGRVLDVAWRMRRRLVGTWRRWTRWEFWPLWLFYPPVIAAIAVLALRYRRATLFTAANPGIPAGGVVGESKFDILRRLGCNDGLVARTALVAGGFSPAERLTMALAFMERNALTFPIVVKPDQGQRGSGVAVVHSREELRRRFDEVSADLLVQEYVPGVEFGIFYYRRPANARGRIYSITAKHFPAVVGDGRSTLERLILADERAVCLERVHRRRHASRLNDVPAAGERVTLVEIGSHCRGSLFVDGSPLATPALAAAVDAAARRFDGFYFGRFDVRADSVEDFRAGSFRILELNGVTSEATHIYDPRTTLASAYRVLFRQWRIAFEIGDSNRRRGVQPATLTELAWLAIRYRRLARMRPAEVQ